MGAKVWLVALLLAGTSSGHAGVVGDADGVGMYTDLSVASQLSTFTINRTMVSCGVGTVAAGDWSGPFAMLMYSTRIGSYQVVEGTIRATGRMRSITRVDGLPVEDAHHDFVAIATSGLAPMHHGVARFDVHMRSTFWSSNNPMCTRSSVVEGGCRFGGRLLAGEIR